MPTIRLTDDQKQKIEAIAQNAPELLIHRARLILAYAAGKPTLQAAGEAGISRGRARYWKRQFISKGLDIFDLEPSSATLRGSSDGGLHAIEETMTPGRVVGRKAAGCAESKPAVPFPEPKPAIGIHPDDTLAVAGRKVWLFHFALMLTHEQGTLLGEDIEELHDMRVATRRMRSAFDVFGQAFDPKIMKHYLKGLRQVGRALGVVRDMDVILAQAIAYRENLKEDKRLGLQPLVTAWEQDINKKRTKLTRHLHSGDYQAFKNEFNEFLQASEPSAQPVSYLGMNAHLHDIVPVIVYERYAAVRAYEAVLPSASIRQLHALRIEFKKFRYVLEYFREILGDVAGRAISELKQLQDHLGELHDTDIACQLVSEFLEKWDEQQLSMPIPSRQNPEPIVSYLAHLNAERYHLVTSFPGLWQKFNRPEFRQYIAQAISVL